MHQGGELPFSIEQRHDCCGKCAVIGFDRIQQLVGKTAQRQTANVTALARTGQRPSSNASQGRTNLGAKALAESLHLPLLVSLGLLELLAGLGRKDHPHQSGRRMSSAGTPRTLPARYAARRRSASSIQMRSIVGSGRSRLCNTPSTRSSRSVGSSLSACSSSSRIPTGITPCRPFQSRRRGSPSTSSAASQGAAGHLYCRAAVTKAIRPP